MFEWFKRKPKASYLSEWLNYLYGGSFETEAGVNVGRTEILKNSTAWRCVNIISDSIATLPFELLDENNNSIKDHQAVKLISIAPNKRQTPYEFKTQVIMHLLIDGNVYIRKIIGVGGKIVSLIVIPPCRIGLDVALDGTITYKISTEDGKILELTDREIIHVKKLSYDGIRGLISSQYMANSIGFATQAEKAGSRLFQFGAFISGFLRTERSMSDEAVRRLKAQFEEKYVSASNSGKPIVLEDGMTYEASNLTAQDFQMLELRDFQRSEIAAFFGVPMHKIDPTKTTSWGTGIEAQNLQFVQDVLQGWVTLIEENISKHLLDQREIGKLKPKFDFSERLRADTQVRTQYYQTMLGGILTPNEIREAEGYGKIPMGDEVYPPPNMTKDMNNEPNNQV